MLDATSRLKQTLMYMNSSSTERLASAAAA
jgi:hypothetical protein